MTVNSYNSEFGYELIATVPYAYWLYKNGELEGTESARDTHCLYYFSPNHKENDRQRSWYYEDTTAVNMMIKSGISNALIHRSKLDTSQWEPPPYKEVYSNSWAVLGKPLFIIYNRYNNEYPATINKPINFFSLGFLSDLFSILTMDYSVVYVNIEGQTRLYDNEPPIHLSDYELCKDSGVTHVKDLLLKHPGLSFNHVLMYYFANCDNFLTMNGGGGILASYFGGKNIIYTQYCKELTCGDFGYYNLLGGSDIKVTRSYEGVLKLI